MQAGTTRSKYILARVRDILGLKDESVIGTDQIFAIATEMSRDIAETYLCVESSMNLSVVANTASYDLTSSGGSPTGFFRLKLLAAPSGATTIVSEYDLNDFDFSKRFSFATTSASVWQINLWAGTLYFFPTPTSTATWVVYFYKSPTTVMSKTVAPETPSCFDTAIVYATVAELAPIIGKGDIAMNYLQLSLAQKQSGMERFRSTKSEPNAIQYQDV